MKKLVGYEIKKGNYKGIDYSHLKLYFQTDSIDQEKGDGYRVETETVKKNIDVVMTSLSVGSKYKVLYDKFGNVEEVIEQY